MKRRFVVISHVASALLRFIRASHINRFLTGFFVVLAMAAALKWIVSALLIPAFITLAPASAFVDFYSIKVSDAQLGTYPSLTLCRRTPLGSVHVDAIRTFVRFEGPRESEVKEYSFNAEVSDQGNECTTVPLVQQPQVVGEYKVKTDVTFTVRGIEKKSSYESNHYQMRNTAASILQEIDSLKARIKALEDEQAALAAPQSQKTVTSTAQPATSTGTSSSNQQRTTSNTQQSSTKGQTNPPAQTPGVLDGIIRGLLGR